MIHQDLVSAYGREDLPAFAKLGAFLLKLIGDVDRLVGTVESLRLQTWLEKARRWGETAEERTRLEWNARNLITLWGPPGSRLFDYSYRHWSGLIRSFYLARWRMWIDWVIAALQKGETVDERALEARLIAWEESWVRGEVPIDADAGGDAVAVSKELYKTYASIVAQRADQIGKREPAWIDGIDALI